VGLYDPNAGRFDLAAAESMLGIDDEQRRLIRLIVSVDLLLAKIGITDEQIDAAYEARIKNDVSDAAHSLRSLVGEGFDERA